MIPGIMQVRSLLLCVYSVLGSHLNLASFSLVSWLSVYPGLLQQT